jgi:hypothetical protein
MLRCVCCENELERLLPHHGLVGLRADDSVTGCLALRISTPAPTDATDNDDCGVKLCVVLPREGATTAEYGGVDVPAPLPSRENLAVSLMGVRVADDDVRFYFATPAADQWHVRRLKV